MRAVAASSDRDDERAVGGAAGDFGGGGAARQQGCGLHAAPPKPLLAGEAGGKADKAGASVGGGRRDFV